MIKIQVDSVTPISKILRGRKIFVDLESDATLIELLHSLSKDFGAEFRDAVFGEDGNKGGNEAGGVGGYDEKKTTILVNGVSAVFLGGANVKLKDGDVVLIMPLLCGG